MSDNHMPPAPEEMGDHLDEEIKETVHDWADDPDGGSVNELNERLDDKLRHTIAGWVGTEETADWKAIGSKMDANTRAALAKWVGAEEHADWSDISSRIESRTRMGIARLIRAERHEAEAAEASWGDIGSKIERDVRGWFGSAVGTDPDADWGAIGTQMFDHVKTAFEKVTKSAKKTGDQAADKPYPQSSKIEIEGEDVPPVVTSSEPVDPDQ